MISHRFLALIVGSVRVRAEARFPEKLVNILSAHGVVLWDVLILDGGLIFTTDLFSYRKIWGLHHLTGSTIHVLKRRGLLVFLRTFRKRKLLIVGFFCFWLIVYILSGIIWTIEVDGNVRLHESEILQMVSEYGLQTRAWARNLDMEKIESELYVHFPEIAWTSVERRGTYVKIRVVEKESDSRPVDTPIDIVAAYDGIISAIMVFQGNPLVSPGMTVVRGDVLIAGYRDGGQIIHAAGNVKATVYLEGYGECALTETDYILTGQKVKRKYLDIGGRRITITGRKPSFEHYLVTESVRKMRGNSQRLPVTLIEQVYSETEKNVTEYSHEQAMELARERALVSLHLQTYSDAEVLNQRVMDISLIGEDFYRVKVQLELELNIGIEN